MVVVDIIGILAAIALPSYNNYVTQSRRATAQSCLIELAQFMERSYTARLTYLQPDGSTPELPETQCRTELTAFYTFGLATTPAVTRTSFVIEATAIGGQAARDTNCTVMSVDQTGARAPTVDCWR